MPVDTDRAVAALILNRRGEALLVRRGKEETWPGYWVLPGGSVKEGENSEQALVRETMEEVGLQFKPLRHLKTGRTPSRKVIEYWLGNAEGVICLAPGEVDAWEWIGQDRLVDRDDLLPAMRRELHEMIDMGIFPVEV
ncbi:MAG: NUDIX domain-containing protein [Planctomycetes bacterium]|nr:NUDIX domain-containing protein [Planctomycetota bacterium]